MDERIDFTRLEQSAPPGDLWPAIAEKLDQRRKRRFMQRLSALAAAVLLAALAVVVIQSPQPLVDGDAVSAQAVELESLQARSARLESRLAAYGDGVVGGGSLEGLVWLEEELGWLDAQLAESPGDIDLWRQRLGLLEELNQRYARDHWGNEVLLAGI